MATLAPTKSNLMKAQTELKLMEEGYDILDKKRKALLGIYKEKQKERDLAKLEVDKALKDASYAIKRAMISMGEENLLEVAGSIPEDTSLSLSQESFMQTKTYKISFNKDKLTLSYPFSSTNVEFDEALISLNGLKEKIFNLAELDNTLNTIEFEMRKTSKKVNSLDKVQIPKYKEEIKEISSKLEERERDEFSKTKIVKKNKLKKANKDK